MFTMDGEQPAKKRMNGWYDSRLVTRNGEDILADLDNYAINSFRKKGLLFSERRDNGATIEGFVPFPSEALSGVFEIDGVDSYRLKLFGISLLWRAAETHLPEFSHIKLGITEREEIKAILLGRYMPKHFEYTVVIGAFDNSYDWTDRNPDNIRLLGTKFVRWCTNGVIIYVALRRRMWNSQNLGRLSAGYEPSKIIGVVHKYHDSHQSRQSEQLFVQHMVKFGSPYRADDLKFEYPAFEFDESGNRVKREP
jgi:hypothetical protein